jgi:hypothetical protein
MRNKGKATRYPGVYRIDENSYWIRAKAVDLRTGKDKEVTKLIEGVSLQEAAQQRAALIEVAKNPAPTASTRPSFRTLRRAGYRIRTGDLQLGKPRLFVSATLSYSDRLPLDTKSSSGTSSFPLPSRSSSWKCW